MRKYEKKHLIEILDLLYDAERTLKKIIFKNSQDVVNELLGDMQNAAIEIGQSVENMMRSDGREIVTMLEEYCEILWNISQSSASKASALCNQLEKKSKSILKSIKDVQEERVVVFLPYKASMWDCFEGAWNKESDDDNTEVFVIPIPYYDKDNNGEFLDVHYENDGYPNNVVLTHYNDLDFAKIHPDTIYIHNPYDDINLVTSVHPFFYSLNLKEFTDELIYIPYFVLQEVNPEDKKAVDKIKHFITVPGVVNADKVYVQSEAMRQIYIDVLTEEHVGTEFGRDYWNKIVFSEKSSKIEKISQLTKEDIEIPEDWKRLIEYGNGHRKKVILYNTSIVPLLGCKQRMIDKIKDVIDVFRDRAEDIILLWRPHPLIEATLCSMHPELYDEYMDIVKQYKEEAWGIFDDTPDVNRAIIISDAYYGDGGSLLQMYKETGKPIMTQNVKILSVKE